MTELNDRSLERFFSLVTKVFDNCFGQMIIHVRHKNGHITNCLTDQFLPVP